MNRTLSAFTTAGAVLTAVIVASPNMASAVPPNHGSFTRVLEGDDPAGTTCDFAVHFAQVETGRYEVFFGHQGNVVGALIHITYEATISANGHTIYERDHWTREFDADGTMRDAGVTVHIQGPGGIVIRDAGTVAYDADGNVSYTNGPHPQLSGESFCSALTE